MIARPRGAALAAGVLAVCLSAQEPDTWTRFRGPNGTGTAGAGATGLPVAFDQEQVRWRTALPAGHSSPVLSAEHVFVTGLASGALTTFALDRATGAVAWRASVPRARESHCDERNHPTSPTPCVDADVVVAFFQDFGLVAYDHAGEELWRHPLGPFENTYGMGASPILVDDRVWLVCDQNRGSYLVAVDKRTGEQAFRVERPMARSGHCTPVVFRPEQGPAQVLVPGSFLLDAYAADTGARVWWVEGLAAEMKSVPALVDGVLYINGYTSPLNDPGNQVVVPEFAPTIAEHDADGDGKISQQEMPRSRYQGYFPFFDLDGDKLLGEQDWAYLRMSMASQNGLLAIRAGGAGDRTADNVLWRYQRSVPQLPSPLVCDGVLYVLADQGGRITTMKPTTGEVLERGRLADAIDNYYAAPVAGDGKVYLLSESGILSVLPAGGSLEPLATHDLGEPCYATPALARGRLFVRTQAHLYCFGSPR